MTRLYVELSLATGRGFAELVALDDAVVATYLTVLDERTS